MIWKNVSDAELNGDPEKVAKKYGVSMSSVYAARSKRGLGGSRSKFSGNRSKKLQKYCNTRNMTCEVPMKLRTLLNNEAKKENITRSELIVEICEKHYKIKFEQIDRK